MRFESIELTGYIGLYQGTLKSNIKVTFGTNRITLIVGPNGSGKSTFLNALTIYPDSNSNFISNQPAEKEIILIEGHNKYKINCVHSLTDKGDRATAKAYIKRLENGQWIEYNPTGTIRSYMDFVNSEFDMDPNYVTLAALSTENKGLVEKTPAERKKYVNSMIDYVTTYNNIHKVLTKRSSIFKSLINSLVSKIDMLGDEEQLKGSLLNIDSRIYQIKSEIQTLTDIIATNNAQIKVLDPDNSIQLLYSSIHIELEKVKNAIKQYEKDKVYLIRNRKYLSSITNIDIESLSKMYADAINNQTRLKDKIELIDKEIEKLLSEREEQYRAIELKNKRISSLKSEFNYDYIIDSIKANQSIIDKCEKIFSDINIQNAISISKDEYVLGLTTMNDIKELVRNIQSSHYKDDIDFAIQCIIDNISIPRLISGLEDKLNNTKLSLEDMSKEYSYYCGLSDRAKILSDRPSKCKIDSCPFISEALEANKVNPEEKVKYWENVIKDLEISIKFDSNELESYRKSLEIVNSLNIIFRNIDNSRVILSKLPYSNIFLDRNTFLENIKKGAHFDDINKLYSYINYANLFEEYKKAIDNLKDLSTEKKIYDSKASSIDELVNDLQDLNNKLNEVMKLIDSKTSELNNLSEQLKISHNIQIEVDELLTIQRGYEEVIKNKNEYESQLNTISSNMDKIKDCLKLIEDASNSKSILDKSLHDIEEEKNGLKYSLAMLRQYKEEMNQYEKSYTIIETIKEYSSPTKNGIQNLFIKVYMAQTLSLANKILGLFFDQRLSFLPFQIDANSFSIPCFSKYTGLTTDDISSCSRSEKAMGSLALSGALLKQASSKFNIFRTDEIEEGLDAENRLYIMKAIYMICDMLNIEQFIMVSHSSELGLENVDIIRFKNGGAEINGIDGHIIANIE